MKLRVRILNSSIKIIAQVFGSTTFPDVAPSQGGEKPPPTWLLKEKEPSEVLCEDGAT